MILLNFLQGFVTAFEAPARQAFVAEMIERREDLPNAIALNSSMFNGARLLARPSRGC
jgi:MFS family permease